MTAAFVAIALFVGSWTLLHVGFYTHKQILDTPVYQRYGNAIADGEVPYRDFDLEYPPGALPMFALPGLAEPGSGQNVTAGFRRTFETLMWLCGAAALAAMAVVLASLRRCAAVWAALCFAALAPLALGSVILSRFDLWPAAIVAAALAALVTGRLRVGHALLGLGIATKLYPVVLVPLGVAYAWKRAGRREALNCLGIVVVVAAAFFLPFVILSPGGVWHSVSVQLGRPLQVESLGSALLLAAPTCSESAWRARRATARRTSPEVPPTSLAIASTVVQAGPWPGSGSRSRAAPGAAIARPLLRGRGLRLRRVRQGAVAAVPDLAHPGRAARARPARALGERAAARARPDAALVSVPLLQAGARLRRGAVVAAACARPRRSSRCGVLVVTA